MNYPEARESPGEQTGAISEGASRTSLVEAFTTFAMLDCPPTRTRAHQHRTWNTLARCRFPSFAWVAGDGPWASISTCGAGTARLHESKAEALASKTFIDETRCGHRCRGAHTVLDLRAVTSSTGGKR